MPNSANERCASPAQSIITLLLSGHLGIAHDIEEESTIREKTAHKMVSAQIFDVRASSRLLQLPREIRDHIYTYALTNSNNIIALKSAIINTSRVAQSQSPSFYKRLEVKFQCHHIRTHRRIWSVPTFDLNVAFGTQDVYNIPKSVSMTYQLDCSYHSLDRPNVSLLRTNKQIHGETSEVMYGRATFCFRGDFALATAFAFLCDRSPVALRLIKRIELSLTEDSNMSGTTAAHYPIMLRSTDSSVLQYAYNHYTDLCTLLSSSRMCLRHLSLWVNNTSTSWRKSDTPETAEEWLSSEEKDVTSLRPFQPAWIEPLLQVHNLESIRVYWGSNSLRARRLADTISILRHHMLKINERTNQEIKNTTAGAPFTFRLLDCKGISSMSDVATLRNFTLREDGTWHESRSYDEDYAKEKHHQQMLKDCRAQSRYICYYETKAI